MSDEVVTEYGIRLRSPGTPAPAELVRAFEQQLGFTLPEDFRSFLLRYNGGKPIPSAFLLRKRTGPYSDSLVHRLEGLEPSERAGLRWLHSFMQYRLPVGFLAIGIDPTGNFICLGLDSDARGRVYFWDHEDEPDPPHPSHMELVADSFDEFLRRLFPADGP